MNDNEINYDHLLNKVGTWRKDFDLGMIEFLRENSFQRLTELAHELNHVDSIIQSQRDPQLSEIFEGFVNKLYFDLQETYPKIKKTKPEKTMDFLRLLAYLPAEGDPDFWFERLKEPEGKKVAKLLLETSHDDSTLSFILDAIAYDKDVEKNLRGLEDELPQNLSKRLKREKKKLGLKLVLDKILEGVKSFISILTLPVFVPIRLAKGLISFISKKFFPKKEITLTQTHEEDEIKEEKRKSSIFALIFELEELLGKAHENERNRVFSIKELLKRFNIEIEEILNRDDEEGLKEIHQSFNHQNREIPAIIYFSLSKETRKKLLRKFLEKDLFVGVTNLRVPELSLAAAWYSELKAETKEEKLKLFDRFSKEENLQEFLKQKDRSLEIVFPLLIPILMHSGNVAVEVVPIDENRDDQKRKKPERKVDENKEEKNIKEKNGEIQKSSFNLPKTSKKMRKQPFDILSRYASIVLKNQKQEKNLYQNLWIKPRHRTRKRRY